MHALTLHPQSGQHQENEVLATAGRFRWGQLQQQPVERDQDQGRQDVEHVALFHQGKGAELPAK